MQREGELESGVGGGPGMLPEGSHGDGGMATFSPHVAGSAGATAAVAAGATGGAPLTTRGAGASAGGTAVDDEAPDGRATELAGEGVGTGSGGEARSKRQSGRRSRADQAHSSNQGRRRGGVPHDVRAADASGADDEEMWML